MYYALNISIAGDNTCPPYLFASFSKAQAKMYKEAQEYCRDYCVDIEPLNDEGASEFSEFSNEEIEALIDGEIELSRSRFWELKFTEEEIIISPENVESFKATIVFINRRFIDDSFKTAIYKEVRRQFLYDDAIRQLGYFFKVETDNGLVSTEDVEERLMSEFPHFEQDDIHQFIDNIIAIFEDDFDANIDENSRWQNAIQKVVDKN